MIFYLPNLHSCINYDSYKFYFSTAVMDSVKMASNRTTEAIETKTDLRIKVECVFPVIIVSILPHAEFEQNDHQEGGPHFTKMSDQSSHSTVASDYQCQFDF